MSEHKLKYKIGNLIEAAKNGEVDVIGHQCNVFCHMGAGIAPQIKKAFPEAWEADKNTERGDFSKMGKCTKGIYQVSDDKYLHIFNLYGQGDWRGRYKGERCTNYIALAKALDIMARWTQSSSRKDSKFKIGLPLIGAGLALGDWKIIEQLIIDAFQYDNLDVTIYVLSEDQLPEGVEINLVK